MKTPKRLYRVKIFCESLRIENVAHISAKRREVAWRAALNVFFAEHPQALSRGLSVGGAVTLAR